MVPNFFGEGILWLGSARVVFGLLRDLETKGGNGRWREGNRTYWGCVEFLYEIECMFGAVLIFRNRAAEFLEEEVELRGGAAVYFLAEGKDDHAVEET